MIKQQGLAGEILQTDKNGIVVATSDQAIKITSLQPQGKKPMTAQDFLNGRSEWVTIQSFAGQNNE